MFFMNFFQQYDNAVRVDILGCADADKFLIVAGFRPSLFLEK